MVEEAAVLRVDVRRHVDDHGRLRVLGLDGLDDLLLVGHGEFEVLVLGEVARPGVEDLDDLGAGIDLVAGVGADVLREEVEDAVEELRFFGSHLADLRESGRRARLALDEVGREREGEADEAATGFDGCL